MLDSNGFDLWARKYNKTVDKYANKYPFDGYYNVLTEVYNMVKNKSNVSILDVGIGTGVLSEKLCTAGSKITGLDFSWEMLEIAAERMTSGEFYLCDFNNGLPRGLLKDKFDYIISTYAIHHVDDDKKIELFKEMLDLLKDDGKIIIADISFDNASDMSICKERSKEDWDNSELYFDIDSLGKKLVLANINYNYKKMSSCAGILEIFKK